MLTPSADLRAKAVPGSSPDTSRREKSNKRSSLLGPGDTDPTLDPEVLIVGAGAVGLVLGIAIARMGRRVTMLEGGPADPPIDYMARNRGPNSGVEHLGLTNGRMKAFGGTTRLWGGQLAPFAPSDFRPTYAGKPIWPLSLDTLQPWFDRAFEFLGLDQADRAPDSIWANAGVAPIDLGPALTAITNSWLPVADFTKLFAADMAGLPHLRIITDMEATAIEFAVDGRAAAITANGRDGHLHRFSAPHIVLANGTMEIVRLLLRAAATAPYCPFAANQNIGRGFIDHLHGIVGRVEGGDIARVRATFGNIRANGCKYSIKIRASDAFLESHGIAHCAVTFYAKGPFRQALSGVRNLYRRAFAQADWRRIGSTLVDAARTTRMLLPILWGHLVRRLAHAPFERGIPLGLEIEQIPVAKSRLFLDPAAPPETGAIGLHWALDGREVVAADLFCAELTRSFAERGLGTIKVDPRIAARDPALLMDLHDAFHHMGGARMAESASEGVVDRDLRVFGCPNLAVAGAATFPSGSFANPTLTALALVLRLSERLANEMAVIA